MFQFFENDYIFCLFFTLSIDCDFCLPLLGTSQAPKAGTDVLLDLLSIGTPLPVQGSLSTPDILSSGQDNKSPIATLDVLSSPSPFSSQSTSAGAASMLDLLDGFGPSPPNPGKIVVHFEILFCAWILST